MRIDGKWHLCPDGTLRPVVVAEVAEGIAADGSWHQFRMLVDTGADRTVFSADVFRDLGFPGTVAMQQLAGIGGEAESVTVDTSFHLTRENGTSVLITGPFAAFTDPKSLDMSILGRDLTNHFAVIVDRPQDVVCLLGQRHRYVVVEA
jgi:Aspartyl protease